jgi:hypothetical protein
MAVTGVTNTTITQTEAQSKTVKMKNVSDAMPKSSDINKYIQVGQGNTKNNQDIYAGTVQNQGQTYTNNLEGNASATTKTSYKDVFPKASDLLKNLNNTKESTNQAQQNNTSNNAQNTTANNVTQTLLSQYNNNNTSQGTNPINQVV